MLSRLLTRGCLYAPPVRLAVLALIGGCGFQVAATGSDGNPGTHDAAVHDATGSEGSLAGPDAAVDAPMPVDIFIEAENFTQNTQPRDVMWVAHIDVPGYSGTSAMRADGGDGDVCPASLIDSVLLCSAAMFYDVNVPVAANYTLWVRMWADSTTVDSLFVTVDDGLALTAQAVDVAEDSTWHWVKPPILTTFSLSVGTHRLGVWQREGGARIDRLALMASSATPP